VTLCSIPSSFIRSPTLRRLHLAVCTVDRMLAIPAPTGQNRLRGQPHLGLASPGGRFVARFQRSKGDEDGSWASVPSGRSVRPVFTPQSSRRSKGFTDFADLREELAPLHGQERRSAKSVQSVEHPPLACSPCLSITGAPCWRYDQTVRHAGPSGHAQSSLGAVFTGYVVPCGDHALRRVGHLGPPRERAA
jgi:hypothetical protein